MFAYTLKHLERPVRIRPPVIDFSGLRPFVQLRQDSAAAGGGETDPAQRRTDCGYRSG